jgi:hypothetical protein
VKKLRLEASVEERLNKNNNKTIGQYGKVVINDSYKSLSMGLDTKSIRNLLRTYQ